MYTGLPNNLVKVKLFFHVLFILTSHAASLHVTMYRHQLQLLCCIQMSRDQEQKTSVSEV